MKQLLFFLLLFYSVIFYGQVPNTPELCLVTVGNDSLVHLKWEYSDTTTINGFIIKRVIYGGIGVVNGTLNNIEILPNYLLFVKDSSNSYSTRANPYKRSEEYSINAFLIRNDSTIFSNLTQLHRTIFLKVKWDECTQKASFSWNKYINRKVRKYSLFVSTDKINYNLLKDFSQSDTNFETVSLAKNIKYYFKIKAILDAQGNCCADTSVSNVANFFTYSPIAPSELSIVSVSVSDNEHINIDFKKKNGSRIEKLLLLRNSSDQIAKFDGQTNNGNFIDNINVSKNNCYRIQALDFCGNILKESDDVCNIFIQLEQNNNSFNLNFTPTEIEGQEPDNYIIMFDVGNGWQDFKQLSNFVGTEIIKLSDIFTNFNYNTLTTIGFKIKATKDGINVFSNEIYLPLNPIIAVPNAFCPTSNYEQDRYFTIKGMFIKKIDLLIFTENNELVFHSTDLNNRWNGNLSNSVLAPAGTYIYHLRYQGNNGLWLKKNGVVNLVKQY